MSISVVPIWTDDTNFEGGVGYLTLKSGVAFDTWFNQASAPYQFAIVKSGLVVTFNETVTTYLRFNVSVDDGATWIFWNGSAWVASDVAGAGVLAATTDYPDLATGFLSLAVPTGRIVVQPYMRRVTAEATTQPKFDTFLITCPAGMPMAGMSQTGWGMEDLVIHTGTQGGTEQSRALGSGSRDRLNLSWSHLYPAEADTLKAFFKSVTSYTTFNVQIPLGATEYTVRVEGGTQRVDPAAGAAPHFTGSVSLITPSVS